MKTIDFGRSFLTFRIDAEKKPPRTASHPPPFSLNNARIQVECRCRVLDKRAGAWQTFVLGASCKTERVGVSRDIWTEPNADFAPVFSEDRFLHLKTFARADVEVDLYPAGSGKQPQRQTGRLAEAFDDVRIDLAEVDARVLAGAEAIVRATLANDPLVACTMWETERYAVRLEYPVKTMNANERDGVYQTDTGPVLLPDLSCEPDCLLERCELAFAAFNCPSWIEFLVRVPTPVSPDVQVHHFARTVRCDAVNQVFRLA